MYEVDKYCTHSHYWILGKNVDLSGSPSGCARRIPLVVVAFGVLSVWWKTSASVSTLFRVVLPQQSSSMIVVWTIPEHERCGEEPNATCTIIWCIYLSSYSGKSNLTRLVKK